MGFNFEEELKKLPKKPGVYIMRDDKDVILYVGKAINLHNRVRSTPWLVEMIATPKPPSTFGISSLFA